MMMTGFPPPAARRLARVAILPPPASSSFLTLLGPLPCPALALAQRPVSFRTRGRSFASSRARLNNNADADAPRTRSSTRQPPPAPFPTVDTCPNPTCACADTPQLPEGLEINHERPLNGNMPAYAEQVLVCTGQDDWTSRIQQESDGDNLAADLGQLMRGDNMPLFHNVSVLNSSFAPSHSPSLSPSPTPSNSPDVPFASAYLLPSFKYVPFVPRDSQDGPGYLLRGYLLPETLSSQYDSLSLDEEARKKMTRDPEAANMLPSVRDVNDVMVLICGHGGRDQRCGIYGPLLRAEFERLLPDAGVRVLKGPEPAQWSGKESEGELTNKEEDDEDFRVGQPTARVGLISHIGGHIFAGNVIVYIPPSAKLRNGSAHPLAGKGIWMGRVEPKHVQGIIQKTILEGSVIADMFRGGIDAERRILRI